MNNTKRLIFKTAVRLFAQNGYEGTSVDQIASACYMAKGTLYYYFRSKEELFNYCVDLGMKVLKRNIVMRSAMATDPVDKIKRVIAIQFELMEKYEKFIALLFSQMWGVDDRQSRLRQYISEYLFILKEIIDECSAAGFIEKGKSDVYAADLFGTMCSAMLCHEILIPSVSLSRVVPDFTHCILEGILNVKD
jgi:AcrR family transcriptional regulator